MERRPEISGIEEQNNPADVAINEQQGPVDLAFIDTMRAKAVVEVGSNPDSHPLRRGRIRPTAEDIDGMAGPKLGQP